MEQPEKEIPTTMRMIKIISRRIIAYYFGEKK